MHFVFKQPFVPAVLPALAGGAGDDRWRWIGCSPAARCSRRRRWRRCAKRSAAIIGPRCDDPYCWIALSGIVSPCALT